MTRQFNAIPYLGYWDIYKNYYANKQEEIGAVIHKDVNLAAVSITSATFENVLPANQSIPVDSTPPAYFTLVPNVNTILRVVGITSNQVTGSDFKLYIRDPLTDDEVSVKATDMFGDYIIIVGQDEIIFYNPKGVWMQIREIKAGGITYNANTNIDTEPKITTFDLANIDTMRQNLLSHFADTPFEITGATLAPYGLTLQKQTAANVWAKQFNQEGLGLKTYQSDLFNNWIDTEWIDGVDGISAVTAIDTSEGSFTIDELNLSRKIYDMLNRIAISGGSYDDWLDAVYTHERQRSAENPMYLGGLIKNLVFQEVISNTATEDQPLGTLAGRGKIGGLHKGGQVVAKIDEPSYIIGIVSITPIIDYSQGNKWDMSLKTMNDLHKPALDEIGFQDLITDQMAWFDTAIDGTTELPIYKSAGKQPAWINYMTNVNRVLGNFADQQQQMFMVLNRRYTALYDVQGQPSIGDLTTYIDPSKFNHIFADTRLDAQNFWTQIRVENTARRKMSAKVIPNL